MRRRISVAMNDNTYIKVAIKFIAWVLRHRIFLYCLGLVSVLWGIGVPWTLDYYGEHLTGEVLRSIGLLLGAITILSLLPAMIYVAFSWREKRRSLAQKLNELDRHRLKAELGSEVRKRFDAAHEPDNYRVPIALTTLAMFVGWVLFFYSRGYAEVDKLLQGVVSVGEFLIGLQGAHPLVFGFLGVYFFTMQTLLRRYLNGDIAASVYMRIAIRVWVVIVLSVVLAAVSGLTLSSDGDVSVTGATLIAICFVAGVLPDVAVDLIQRMARLGVRVGTLQSIRDIHPPLTSLQGLNLWHQARLADEGIDNVQNLAESDIKDLIVNTKFGFLLLMDWIDQALLRVHVTDSQLEAFRKVGIRTATDLEFVYMELMGSKLGETVSASAVPSELVSAWGQEQGPGDALKCLLIAIRSDDNYAELLKLRRLSRGFSQPRDRSGPS